jgi:hypothetical protein
LNSIVDLLALTSIYEQDTHDRTSMGEGFGDIGNIPVYSSLQLVHRFHIWPLANSLNPITGSFAFMPNTGCS